MRNEDTKTTSKPEELGFCIHVIPQPHLYVSVYNLLPSQVEEGEQLGHLCGERSSVHASQIPSLNGPLLCTQIDCQSRYSWRGLPEPMVVKARVPEIRHLIFIFNLLINDNVSCISHLLPENLCYPVSHPIKKNIWFLSNSLPLVYILMLLLLLESKY